MSVGALVTLDEAKSHLRISASTTSEDERLNALIDAASGLVQSMCHRTLIQRSVTEQHEGSRKRIYVRARPIVSVTTFVDPANNAVPSTDYIVKGDLGILEHSGRFPMAATTTGQRTRWLITMVVGHWATENDVEPAVKNGCLRLVSLLRDNPGSGVESVRVGDLAVSYAGTRSQYADTIYGQLPDEVLMAIAPYRGVEV